MDLIYESYQLDLINEIVSKYTQIKGSTDRPIAKALDDIANEVGAINKGIFYKDANLSQVNLVQEGKDLWKLIGAGAVGLAIIKDTESDNIQIIIHNGGSIRYNASGLYQKVKSLDEIVPILKKYMRDLRPTPSDKDVNSTMGRFRNGRM